jgi:hypothetical protein
MRLALLMRLDNQILVVIELLGTLRCDGLEAAPESTDVDRLVKDF